MTGTGSPLRIAVYHDLPSGGAKRTVHAQVRGLVDRGHRVECFVTSTGEEDFLPLADVAHRVITVPVPAPPDREKTLAGRPTPADLSGWLRVLRGIRRAGSAVAAAVSTEGFDVLLVHPSQFTQAPHVLRFARLPTVYYCHELLRAAYEPGITTGWMRFVLRHTLGRVDRRNARAAGVIAVNSEYTGRRVEQAYGRTSTVAPPGVDIDAFRPVDGPRGDYVLTVGALHPLKGMDTVVDAVGGIPTSVRPRLIVVSGRARERDRARIQTRTRDHGVELDLRERVSDAELAELYARARAVVFAPHREPLGLVPLEAMAAGTPVVAAREGGIPETVMDGQTGYLVPRDPTALAERIQYLLENREEAEAMARAGRERVVKHWNWDRSVDALEAVLRAAAEGS